MKLQNLTLKEFLKKTASMEAMPGGGCSVALMAAIAAALTEMVANLTIGKKEYVEVEERMKEIVVIMSKSRKHFINDIESDAVAYQHVIDAYRLPKNSEEEIKLREKKIQYAFKVASYAPMALAQRAYNLLDIIKETLDKGNINVVADGEVAFIACQAAIKGALLNIRTNLKNINDDEFVTFMEAKCNEIEKSTH